MRAESLGRSGVPARVALGCNALPDELFLIGGHEDPLSDLGHGTATTPADVVEGGRTHGDTGRIRTFGDGLHHSVETRDISFI